MGYSDSEATELVEDLFEFAHKYMIEKLKVCFLRIWFLIWTTPHFKNLNSQADCVAVFWEKPSKDRVLLRFVLTYIHGIEDLKGTFKHGLLICI